MILLEHIPVKVAEPGWRLLPLGFILMPSSYSSLSGWLLTPSLKLTLLSCCISSLLSSPLSLFNCFIFYSENLSLDVRQEEINDAEKRISAAEYLLPQEKRAWEEGSPWDEKGHHHHEKTWWWSLSRRMEGKRFQKEAFVLAPALITSCHPTGPTDWFWWSHSPNRFSGILWSRK